ncbi:DUF3786 domain-containing protein [Bacillota bacterium LX-D]|nr:DUF3786 domain-containing protein [Bacillota bacterium LX-D]
MYPYMVDPRGEGSYDEAFDASRARLAALTVEQIQEKTLCPFSKTTNTFSLGSFGQKLEILYPEGKIYFAGHPECQPLLWWALIALNYLSAAKKVPLTYNWVSYKDLPDGRVFFPNIKKTVLEPLSSLYGACEKTIFLTAVQQLGFSIVDGKADLTLHGWFAPRIPILAQFWNEDEELPSSCQILFDSSIAEQMHIEDSAALCNAIADLIMGQYKYCLSKL